MTALLDAHDVTAATLCDLVTGALDSHLQLTAKKGVFRMRRLQNESPTDRIIRIGVGMLAACAAYTVPGARELWGIVAAIALISSVSGFSPFYGMVGISTSKGEQP